MAQEEPVHSRESAAKELQNARTRTPDVEHVAYHKGHLWSQFEHEVGTIRSSCYRLCVALKSDLDLFDLAVRTFHNVHLDVGAMFAGQHVLRTGTDVLCDAFKNVCGIIHIMTWKWQIESDEDACTSMRIKGFSPIYVDAMSLICGRAVNYVTRQKQLRRSTSCLLE